MRLTLRTLLAYLDDTLEPAEIKTIGQKVSESDAAQELIARIKQVTRRRRLTTPPTSGPAGKQFDPNTVAEYLDNELDSEQVALLEKLCLESDVHLAEIAACHQILTLVLGEPALVPPTAKERMYGLVKGREAIPFRKAPSQPPATASVLEDGDDALMPFGRLRAGWTLWGGLLAGFCLFLVLGYALWRTVAPGPDAGRQQASNGKNKTDAPEAIGDPAGKGKEDDKEKDKSQPREKERDKEKDKERTKDDEKGKGLPKEEEKKPPVVAGEPKPVERVAPDLERRELATYSIVPRALPSLLLSKPKEGDTWRRRAPGERLASMEPLVSLPGSPSEIRMDGGVHLQMWGSLPDFTPSPFLLESAVTLHWAKGLDLDFTIERGRVYISNHKAMGAALVRIRFEKEIWDLVLQEPGTEVAIDYLKNYTPDTDYQSGEEPRAELYLCILQGRASLKTDTYHEFPNLTGPPGPAMFSWDNKGAGARGPQRLERPLPVWSKELPSNDSVAEMRLAIEEISKRMVDRKAVDIVLLEGTQSTKNSHHVLSILSLGAIDAVPTLLDILGDEDPRRGQDRNVAIFALRRWISRGAAHAKRLYDVKSNTGLLAEKKYSRGESQTILELLHPFSETKRRDPLTYEALSNYLKHDKLAIRELGYWHLTRLAEGVRTPAFNPTMPAAQREAVANEFMKLIQEKKLPPPLAGSGGAPPN